MDPTTIPKSLTKLVFGDNFNQSINGILPHLDKLKTLEFGKNFNNGGEEFAANVFPKSLAQLIFNKDDKHPMVYKLHTINFKGPTQDITFKAGKSDVDPKYFPFNTIPPTPNYYFESPRDASSSKNNKQTKQMVKRPITFTTPPFTNNIDISKINFIRFDIQTFSF